MLGCQEQSRFDENDSQKQFMIRYCDVICTIAPELKLAHASVKGLRTGGASRSENIPSHDFKLLFQSLTARLINGRDGFLDIITRRFRREVPCPSAN